MDWVSHQRDVSPARLRSNNNLRDESEWRAVAKP